MAMTSVSGISEFFCGSAVTYRNDTKARWLGVSADDLANPAIGAVSSQVAEQMCRGVLDRTPEASLAAAITGHLGPNAPEGLDGVVYIGLVFRSTAPATAPATVQRHLLSAQTEVAERQRPVRQQEAAVLVLQSILAELKRQTH